MEKENKTVKKVEDLNVYNRARILTKSIYEITRTGAFSKDFGLRDQIRRASVSIMSNIAEGFERGGKAEFIMFLYIAKGSCGEVRAQLQVALDQNYLEQAAYQNFYDQCNLINGMIANFISYLKQSPYQGIKYKQSQPLPPKP